MELCETFQKFYMFDYDIEVAMANCIRGIVGIFYQILWLQDGRTQQACFLKLYHPHVTNFWNLEVSTLHNSRHHPSSHPGTESSALWYKLLFGSYPGVIQCKAAACVGFRATLSLGPIAGRLVPTGVERWVDCCHGGFGKCHGESWQMPCEWNKDEWTLANTLCGKMWYTKVRLQCVRKE